MPPSGKYLPLYGVSRCCHQIFLAAYYSDSTASREGFLLHGSDLGSTFGVVRYRKYHNFRVD